MSIWAIADLHLSFGTPNKKMDVFGPSWENHAEKIEKNWLSHIQDKDLVLIPGDISWAMRPEEAAVDLEWIARLPGTKVMIRGNHDYWWTSLSKIKKVLPPTIHVLQNDAFHWQGVGVAGVRLWDSPEYNFGSYVEMVKTEGMKEKTEESSSLEESEKIFQRELLRLELSLKCLRPDTQLRIVMTHYPPIGANLQDSQVSELLEKYKVNICIFGHLHNIRKGALKFGSKNGIEYALTSCDYLDFQPLLLVK